MADQWTCGMGIAAHSTLPRLLGDLTNAVASILEAHMLALDLTDEHARQEHAAYQRLATEHRQTAGLLLATSDAMAGYRDLPMGTHDMQVIASPKAAEAFAKFVEREQALLELLQQRLEEDQNMLAMMSGAEKSTN